MDRIMIVKINGIIEKLYLAKMSVAEIQHMYQKANSWEVIGYVNCWNNWAIR